MDAKKILLGGLTLLAAGALVGVLFAPKKGSKTRKKIKQKGEDYADDVKDKFDDIIGYMNRKYQNIIYKTETILSTGKSKYDHAIHEVDELASNTNLSDGHHVK